MNTPISGHALDAVTKYPQHLYSPDSLDNQVIQISSQSLALSGHSILTSTQIINIIINIIVITIIIDRC